MALTDERIDNAMNRPEFRDVDPDTVVCDCCGAVVCKDDACPTDSGGWVCDECKGEAESINYSEDDDE